jgi:23S rRNA (uracil1939-C5)-methyltransferase
MARAYDPAAALAIGAASATCRPLRWPPPERQAMLAERDPIHGAPISLSTPTPPLACPHRPPCPGCPRFGNPALDPTAQAALAALAREAGLPPPPVRTGPALGFRHRARLMVRGRSASPKLGLFQLGSHRIVDVPRCPIHHPRVNELAAAVRQAIRETNTPPYAERPHTGALRAVQIAVARDGRRAQLVLVGNAHRADPLRALADRLRDAPGLVSLWWNGQPERSNAILGPHWQPLAGEEALRDEVAGVAVHYLPGAFGQSQPHLAEALVQRLRAWVPDGARVAELHAGVGPIGLGLLGRCAEVRFNEVVPHALEGLRRGLAERSSDEQARATIAPGAAEEHLALLDGADTVVVDPPRRGLGTPLCEALAGRPPERLLYASCGLASFLRETKRLLADSRLRLTALEAVALFPYTAHVETLARFERRAPAAGRV